MITLISGGEIFSPDPLGIKDLLISGEKIIAIEKPGQIKIQGIAIENIDASGKKILPGFVDGHVHILGGGGEGGPETRTPEITLSQITRNGVTTVVGCLGTDGTTRHMESLLAKAFGLEKEGITTFIYSGSYQLPAPTITGSICSDLILINKVIGAGEIAISDHRSSQPTFEQIARLAAECRVGGMLGGKAGILHLHLGDGQQRLEYLFRLVKETQIPATQVIPTHINRTPSLLEQAVEFTKIGGFIDITADDGLNDGIGLSTADSVKYCLKNKASLERITISSDSNGSLPLFDKKGNLVDFTIATQKVLLEGFQELLKGNILDVSPAIKMFSTNPARFLKLRAKGAIQRDYDADLIMFDENWEITDVLALGKRMVAEKKILVKGTFEM